MTFEQLGQGARIYVQCGCGCRCPELPWQVVRLEIGAVVLQSLKAAGVFFRALRHWDGGLTDSTGSRLRMRAPGPAQWG